MHLLIDAGGTESKIALSGAGHDFVGPVIIDTPKVFEEAIRAYKTIAKKLSGTVAIRAVAMGVAGHLDKEKRKLLDSPNLPDWNVRPLKEEMQKAIGATVCLENDTALAGLGESIYGAGKGRGIVAYVTVSTGVNGVRIVDGKIDRNAYGFEIGHQFAGSFGNGDPRYLEDCISGASIEKKFNKKPYDIADREFWGELARILAYGINNTILHWSPDVMVLGGSMIKDNGIRLEEVKEHLVKILKIFPEHPPISKCELGKLGGIYGAMFFLKQMRSGLMPANPDK